MRRKSLRVGTSVATGRGESAMQINGRNSDHASFTPTRNGEQSALDHQGILVRQNPWRKHIAPTSTRRASRHRASR